MMSIVEPPFMNANYLGPINSFADLRILLRGILDRIFLNLDTMQIGLIFSNFGVLFGLAMGKSMVELTPISLPSVMAQLNSSTMVIDAFYMNIQKVLR